MPRLNPEKMAYLAGGAEQVVNLAIVNLVQQGCVKPVPATRSVVLQTMPSHQASADRAAVVAVAVVGAGGAVVDESISA